MPHAGSSTSSQKRTRPRSSNMRSRKASLSTTWVCGRHDATRPALIVRKVQAAIALTTLVDNPSTAENAVLANIGLYNARERLRAPYNERLQYTGTATVASLTAVPVSVAQDIDDTRMRLDAVATALKPEYVRQRAFPALLGSAVTMVERVIPFLKMSPCVLPAPEHKL
jgi:hypothetical protein